MTDDGPDGVRGQDQGSTKGNPNPRRGMIKSMLGSNDGTLGGYIRLDVEQRPCLASVVLDRGEYLGPRSTTEDRRQKEKKGKGKGKEGVPTWRPGEPSRLDWECGSVGGTSQVGELVLPWSFLG